VAAKDLNQQFVDDFRNSAPYINAFRNGTFVVVFGGEAVADPAFSGLIHDIALLNSIGIKLVLVHGARPQIEQRLKQRNARIEYVSGLRITDDEALVCVKEAASTVRVEIEALLSMGVANSPMAGARIRVASGNFVTARPLGIHEGVDYQHTGEVRRIDVAAIEERLAHNDIVLLTPLGYSPTGEVFNLSADDVATAAAIQLQADKLIYLVEDKGVLDSRRRLLREMGVARAEQYFANKKQIRASDRSLQLAIHACRHGVRRSHIISRSVDGALLLELFTRDGIGTLITDDIYDETHTATIDDVGGILEMIQPLEEQGVLVRRSRELIEMEIDHFTVMERDGMIIGCAALYPDHEKHVGELACLVIHPDYQGQGRGDSLLQLIEKQALQNELDTLFALTTRTTHWFRERGFSPADIKSLPLKRKAMYNFQRNSRAFIKKI